MEPQRAEGEPTVGQQAPRTGRQRKIKPIRKTSYTLAELHDLIQRRRHQEPSPEEIARRTSIVRRMERLRAKLPPTDVPVDELIRQAREEMTSG